MSVTARGCVGVFAALISGAAAISVPGSQSLAGPACADYTTYPTGGPIPRELNLNGFVARDIDEPSKSHIGVGKGLYVSGDGIVIVLPFDAKETTLKARGSCGPFEVVGLSFAGASAGHLTVDYSTQPPSDYTLVGPEIRKIIVLGSCGEGVVASICAIPR